MASLSKKFRQYIRDKAIKKAETRIILAGRTVESFSPEELEVIVREEEDNIKSSYKERGLLTLAALLGLSLWS